MSPSRNGVEPAKAADAFMRSEGSAPASDSFNGLLPSLSATPDSRASDFIPTHDLRSLRDSLASLARLVQVHLADLAGPVEVLAPTRYRWNGGRQKCSRSRPPRAPTDPEPPPPPTGAATFTPISANRKLAPVQLTTGCQRPRPRPAGPFVSTTNVSIAATCADACPFKSRGCYVTAGFTRFQSARLDRAAEGLTAEQVIAEEVRLIDAAFGGGPIPQDGARGGRDLRLHVGGDVGSAEGARHLGGAAQRWVRRRGGARWTFTHAWREVPRDAWGSAISVVASVERPEDIEAARAAGYAAAIALAEFPSDRAFRLPGTTARIIPCPAETRGRTCVECRLCLDDQRLLAINAAIAFAVHGPAAKQAREQLVRLRRGRGPQSEGPGGDNTLEAAASGVPA